MKQLVIIMSLVLIGSIANAAGPKDGKRYCNPSVSKPCGNGCISLAKQCKVPWTTSISGKRPVSASASFEAPKYVETAPQ